MTSVSIAIVDYNMGNIQSIRNALHVVADDIRIVSDGSELGSPQAIVLPGVGSFADGMENLRKQGFIEPLTEMVKKEEVPYLGICLGLQFLAENSTENGLRGGLGWIPGKVVRVSPQSESVRVPHMGWNSVDTSAREDSILFHGFNSEGTFYFVHSYHLNPETTTDSIVTATTWHGEEITAAIRKDNIFGVQFHPEKSQGAGLRVLENFVNYANGGDALSSNHA
jgi:glutamine amidotransferase